MRRIITTFAIAMYYALDLALWAGTGMRAPLMASSDIAGIGFSCFVGGLAGKLAQEIIGRAVGAASRQTRDRLA